MSGLLATFRLEVIRVFPTIIFEMFDKKSDTSALVQGTAIVVYEPLGVRFERDRASTGCTFGKGGTNKGKDSFVSLCSGFYLRIDNVTVVHRLLTAAKTPMMATTINSSIRVKPF